MDIALLLPSMNQRRLKRQFLKSASNNFIHWRSIMKQYICIDVGGTSIKYGILEQSGRFLDTSEIPTEAHLGGPAIIEKMKSIIREYLSSYTPDGICVSTAGMEDCEKGS